MSYINSNITTFIPTSISFLDPRQWHPPYDRPVASQPLSVPIVLLAPVFSALLSRATRINIALPAFLYLAYVTRATSAGSPQADFTRAALMFGCMLKYIDYGMLVKEDDLWKVKHGPPGSQSYAKWKKSRGYLGKLKDSAELYNFNLRGIGWNWKVNGIPEREPQSKSYFLFRAFLRLLGSYLALDVSRFIESQFSYVTTHPHTSFFALPLTTQVVLTWLHQLEAFTVFNIPYQLSALIMVMSNLHTEADWPPLFGKLSDAYLVARAWGRTWQQTTRRQLAILTPHVQRWLGARSRGAKRTVALFCSFFVSGILHWIGAWNLPWAPSSGGMFWYFMMQAPVVRIEDMVVDWGRKNKISGTAFLRAIGWAWTFTWISFSMRYAARYQYESGPMSVFHPMKYSLIGLLSSWMTS